MNRATISIDGMPVPVEDILGEYSNKKTSNHVLAGYWKNWVDNPEMEKSLKWNFQMLVHCMKLCNG